MLSYQHAYHAGNFADVLKHVVLVQVLTYLQKKDKPFCYLDTHAGAGRYRLTVGGVQKNKEYLGGIGKLWQRGDLPDAVASYADLIKQLNPRGHLSDYPGSPSIALRLSGNQDRLFLYELHPSEYRQLNDFFMEDKRCKAFHADGLKDSLGLLPPQERRGVILIDPSYEIKNDYQAVAEALKAMYKRFATGCYLLWCPVVERKRTRYLERALHSSGIGNIQLFELGIAPDSVEFGMTACCMFVVNPPYTLLAGMQNALPWLADVLGELGQGHYRIEQLSK